MGEWRKVSSNLKAVTHEHSRGALTGDSGYFLDHMERPD